jgi:FkbM family methyltransferase
MNRRIRELVIEQDLVRLKALGVELDDADDNGIQKTLGAYRYCAMSGEFDHLPLFLKPHAASIDVGANVGQYALKLAANTKRCLVIEPAKEQAWLEEVLPPNCSFVNLAAGSADGSATLRIPVIDGDRVPGLSTLTEDALEGADCIEQPTQVRTLDGLVAEMFGDEEIGFIKIDVEGYEIQVIEGARGLLGEHRPNLQVEIWPEHVRETVPVLHDLEYRGLFFFDGVAYDISAFDPAVHCVEERSWNAGDPGSFDPTLYVINFFFVPLQ